MICGLNGVGKSTLGRALAEKLNFSISSFSFVYKSGSYFSFLNAKTIPATPHPNPATNAMGVRALSRNGTVGSTAATIIKIMPNRFRIDLK